MMYAHHRTPRGESTFGPTHLDLPFTGVFLAAAKKKSTSASSLVMRVQACGYLGPKGTSGGSKASKVDSLKPRSVQKVASQPVLNTRINLASSRHVKGQFR